MKKTILTAVMVLASSSAMAGQTINLTAGSTIQIHPGQETTISCQGGQSTGRCSMAKDSFGYFNVFQDGKTVASSLSLDNALSLISKLNSSGLCN